MADLTRYSYDRETGAFNGLVEATASPLEPGVLLEPAFSTPTPPPEVAALQVAVWAGVSWKVVTDHRGETWYRDREAVLIVDLGDPADLGLTAAPAPLPPPPPPSSCSKLGLKRAFTEKGLWPTVKAMIASDEDMQEDWDLAVELRITDPIVKKAVAGLALLGTALTPDDVQALVTRANELVA
ncbi:hypothetical protein [Methylobacterium sp. 1973]|uniref:hypothetical protein n=1 Tax=Methylobacterium sp. 1973 TaxID=3156421 RepID=UPI0033911F54